MTVRTVLRKTAKHGWWVVILALMVATVVSLLLSTVLPYQPFQLHNFELKPRTVCPGEDIDAYATREYTRDFESLHLRETWTTVDVPGVPADRPVRSEEGYLPPFTLKTTSGNETKPSPLLDKAPEEPGVYKVKVTATAKGSRWFGVINAKTTSVKYSNLVTVRECEDE